MKIQYVCLYNYYSYLFFKKNMDYLLETSGMILTGSLSNDVLASAVFGGLFSIMIVSIILSVVIWVFLIISQWKVFEKAWLPGWWTLIPFYNIYLTFKLWWRPGGWTRWVLFFPVLAVLMIVVNFDIAKRFNKHRAFGLWLWFLPIVFIPILAFDKKSKRTPVAK